MQKGTPVLARSAPQLLGEEIGFKLIYAILFGSLSHGSTELMQPH
jgi:hypothetical protein